MGEVYRARDTRLDRVVAIKVLGAGLGSSPDLKARFEREAKVISQLQHPHICVLHDVGSANGIDFLVMEFLEGDSLADRLKRGPLPVPELLKAAIQIADGLDKAHRAGVVHRDLKPANVMLTKSGAKLLDFGLAKPNVSAAAATAGGGAASVLSAALTLTSPSPSPAMPLSTAGAVLGTIPYMSPEQIQGMPADQRSDIFAFGAMLFEMATGKRAFDGKSQASVVGAILANDPPPIRSIISARPPELERLVRACLQKDPDERFQTIHDVKLRLIEIAETPAAANSQSTRLGRRALVWVLAGAALLVMGTAAAMYSVHPSSTPLLRLAFAAPPGLDFNEVYPDSANISPDGQKIAFSASTPDGKWNLWVRRLDSDELQQIPGSTNPLEPFWSPDSRSIAFGSEGKLKIADLSGGAAQPICDAARMTGGSWGRNGTIVFGSDYGSVLYQIPATGGQPKPATQKLAEGPDYGHTSPWFLPDGKHFLYRININSAPQGVWVGSVDSLDRKQLLRDNTVAIYAQGYLIFVRSRALVAQEFDVRTLELKGEAAPLIAKDAATNQNGGGARFSVSDNGTLLWQGVWNARYQLRWFDRAGKILGNIGEPILVGSGEEPHLSPDGKRLLVKRDNNIWVLDLVRGTEIRLTSQFSQLPLWMADGKHVIYQASAQGVKRGIMLASPTGVGEGELVAEGVKFPTDASPDGRYIVYMMRGEKTRLDVWALQLFGDHKEYPLLNSSFDERETQFSPDGHWLAYVSDESGNYEIYVRPFTADGKLGDDKKRVSINGGYQPVWNPNGKELFYRSADDHMMTVPISRKGEQLELGAPQALFQAKGLSHYGISHEYDVSPDGQKFLIGVALNDTHNPAPTVILNWQAALKK